MARAVGCEPEPLGILARRGVILVHTPTRCHPKRSRSHQRQGVCTTKSNQTAVRRARPSPEWNGQLEGPLVSIVRHVVFLSLARLASTLRRWRGRSFAALPRPDAKRLIGAIGHPERTVAPGTSRDIALTGCGRARGDGRTRGGRRTHGNARFARRL